MEKIVISSFCQSRDQATCKIPLRDLIPEIELNFDQKKEGYRKGVVLVPLAPKNFIGRIVTLQRGDTLRGEFSPRHTGEEPRKSQELATEGDQVRNSLTGLRPFTPDPLVAVDAVLYHKDVLAEGNENSDPAADWEVIAILTKISEEDQPMPPETLLSNHFLASGGTATHMSPEAFEAAMRKSFNFWKDKAIWNPGKP